MNCGYHPEREAVGTCVDCERGICEFCKTIINAKMHCPDCIEKSYTSPNITTPETKGTSTSKPAYSHPKYIIHWRWVFLMLLLSVGTIFFIHLGSDTEEMMRTGLSGNLGINSISQVAPLPTSDWVGTDGETEYEYTSCGTDCYYVGADGHPIVLVNNPNAKNPTWEELKIFLVVDHTDNQSYVEGSFTCGDFAEVLHNNAEKAGVRAAWVAIDFSSGGVGHANNAFNTTDEGLVYIDDTGIRDTDLIRNSGCFRDRKVAVSIGSEYIAESIFPCVWYDEWESMGIVTSVSIQW
jgi:hypothetical protein